MVRSRRAWTQLAAYGGLLAVSVALLAWLVWLLRGGDLDRNVKLASVAGLFVSLAGLGLAAASLRVSILQLRQPPATLTDDERLDRAADALATAVKAQWQAEAGLRALHRPAPLQLTWSATARPVTAPAETVAGGRIMGRVVRLRLHGQLDQVAERFLALPHRRLVVLGEPGGGKTMLALLLTLALLDRRQPGQPVPVLLPLASWDPTTEHLHTWLTRRLAEDYPALASPAYGPAAAQQLVTTGRVLPVLDGLDELPEQLRPQAIRELDRARADQPLVVTCRSQEYQQAVAAGGGVLAAAAVVELEPVTAAEAMAFLRAAAGPAAARWEPVAAHLHAHPDGPLAAALSTPLMVALARTIYSTPGRDPTELADLARTGGQAAVERYLLDGFVPAAYTSPPPAPDTPPPRLRRPPSPDQARRWLTLLATHLHQRQARDLAWWELRYVVPRRSRRLVFWVGFGLVLGLGLEFMFTVRFVFGMLMLGFGLMFWVAFGPGRGPEKTPARVNTRIRGRLGDLIGKIAVGLRRRLAWGLAVLAAVLIVLFSAGDVTGLLLFVLVFGLGIWLVVGLVVGLVTWLQSPMDDALAVTPDSVLRSDRTVAAVLGLVVGLVVGLLPGLLFGLVFVFWFWLVIGLVVGLVAGLMAGLGRTCWGQFTILRAWLAVRGQLPLRLMAFLDDAHHRGVLRQAGAAYQFRHARLQDHLADISLRSQPDTG